MLVITPELEIVDNRDSSIRYLEHGWPSPLCRWHFHQEYEVHLIVETAGRAFIGDYIGSFEKGALFLIGPYVPHNWITDKKTTSSSPLRDMLFQFNADLFNPSTFPEFHELSNLFELSLSGIEFVGFDLEYAKKKLTNIKKEQGFKRMLIAFDFLDSLNKWPHKKILSLSHMNKAINMKKHDHINRVINYIFEHYADSITLKEVSSMVGYSESSFSRHFHANTGNNFSSFLNRVRIGQACMMLYQSSHSVSRICYEVGFQNLSNFNRQFNKLKNMTPTQYRKQAQKDLTKVI